ncbi:TonB-dependent receptor plug domain-containing protein [Novosphingobium tardum]|uniref:TonB-dependent receptor plug domain-containing protein n=1 Tax=Novosphingobium tardum TaxID=1538021 RepID=A0ABV8RKM2_9SPHN
MKKFVTLKASAAPIALGIALAGAPAFAQDATTPADDTTAAAPTAEPIVVTGSRILSPNQTSIAPVTTVTSDDIKLTGTTRTEDLLNSLPQVTAGQSSQLANGASGTATVDLRGLGPSRTLVLINGRRLMTGDPNSTTSAADLNFIPASLVKRVDVLTGGASATYGADAVAGVVNFIMDTDFTGFRIDANYGLYTHSNHDKTTPPLLLARQKAGFKNYGFPTGHNADGAQYDVTASFGANFADNAGHFTAYVGYRKANPLLQARRDFSSCTIQNTGSASATGAVTGLQCGGSATSDTGTVFYFQSDTTSSTVGALGAGTLTRGTLNRYNFAPLNYFQRPDERYTAGAFADYEISPAIHPYMEFMFMDDRTLAQIAPSGDFGNTLTINCDNPLMSASQRAQICVPANLINTYLGNFPVAANAGYNPNGASPTNPALVFSDPTTGNPYNIAFLQPLRRNVEGGPRINDLQHTSYRAVLGSRGELGSSWSYDAYYQYGKTEYSQRYQNEFSVSRLTSALDAVLAPTTYTGNNFVLNSAGQKVVCRSALSGDANCVPYDLLGGKPSAGALAYVQGSGFLRGQTSEQVASATINGSLGDYGLKFPWASDGVSVALGTEYRKEKLELFADNAFQTGDLSGQGAPTKDVAGSYDVVEAFGEIEVPIVQDSFIYSLSLNGGYRYSHYSISNGQKYNTDTYKLGVDFAPVRDLRFRAGYNRAVRVPNIQELFAPQIVALDGSTDPCSGAPITAADTGCLAQGLRVGQTVAGNPAGQYNGLIGGTPTLRPEVSTTKTLGVVLAPRWVPSLTLSADFFDIKVKGAIQSFGADAILNACVNDTNLFACGLVHRNAAGSLWLTSDGYVQDLATNIGSVKTRGFEFNGNYGTEIGSLGRLSFSFVGTLLDKFVTDNGLTDPYDCRGFFGPTCGVPLPKWRHKARVGFTAPNGLGASLQWRHIGSTDIEYKNSSPSLNGKYYAFASHLRPVNYFDLALTANIGDHFSWRLGANNLFDKDPPLVSSGNSAGSASGCASVVCNGNTYPGMYDSLGRYVYTGITLDF